MNRSHSEILVAAVVLALAMGFSTLAEAQETSEQVQGQRQQTLREGADNGSQGAGQTGEAAQRRRGPGDGSGNQGVKPQDRTGNGSPGRLGAEAGKANGIGKRARASKNSSGQAGGRGSGSSTQVRTRSRSLNSSGTCTGSGSGPMRRSQRSGGAGRR